MFARKTSIASGIRLALLVIVAAFAFGAAADVGAGRETPEKLSNLDRQTAWLPEVSVVQVYDVEARPQDAKQASDPKSVDHAKGFPLRPYGEDVWIDVWHVRTLRGKDAEQFAKLWRAMDFGGMGLMCHHPGYAVRCFDASGKMILETSICWGCNNLFIRVEGGYGWTSFHSQNAEAQALLAYCRQVMKDPEARAPGEAGADAILVAEPPRYAPDAVDAWNSDRQAQTDASLATLRGYSRMQELSLFSEQITDDGLTTLDTLTGLRSLALRTPKVGDAGLAHVTGLHRLVELELGCRHMRDESLKSVAKLKGLQTLGIETDGITDVGLRRLARLTELRTLTLQGRGITDAGLVTLAAMKKLELLSLDNTAVRGPGLRSLRAASALTSLRLERSAITDDGLAAVTELPALELLCLDGAPGITDAGMANVTRCQKVYRVSLENTSIGDEGVKHLSSMPKLSHLHLRGTRVTDASIDVLKAMPYLEAVWIRETQVSEEGIARLKRERPRVMVQ